MTKSTHSRLTEFYQIVVGEVELPRVGVLPSPLVTRTKIFAFVIGSETNTGVAIANPNKDQEITITARRISSDGALLETVEVPLAALNQLPAFLNQDAFFPGLVDFEGLVEFESEDSFILVTLRSDNDLLAAVSALTPESDSQLTAGSVTTEILAEGAVTGDKIADGVVVRSLNGLRDELTLAAGSNVTITPLGSTLTIASSGEGPAGNNATGDSSTVAGGRGSAASGASSTVGGGLSNAASGDSSTVAGGRSNEAIRQGSTVGGGVQNEASGNKSTVGGGEGNDGIGLWSTVGGGLFNRATGYASTIPGGFANKASGSHSFAAGRNAKAVTDYTLVWNSRNLNFVSTGSDRFLINANVGIKTNDPLTQLHVDGFVRASGFDPSSSRELKKDILQLSPERP